MCRRQLLARSAALAPLQRTVESHRGLAALPRSIVSLRCLTPLWESYGNVSRTVGSHGWLAMVGSHSVGSHQAHTRIVVSLHCLAPLACSVGSYRWLALLARPVGLLR